MKEIRFRYGLAIKTFFIWLLSTSLLLVAMVLPIMWYYSDNQIYLLLTLGIFFFFLLINYVLSKRDFLILNSDGITLNYLLGKRKVISWDRIKKIEYIEKWKERIGWEVLYKTDVNRNGNLKKFPTLFIPDCHVAAPNEIVTNALKRGFQGYKCNERQHLDSFEYYATNDNQFIGISILSMICVVLNILYFYLDHVLRPSNLNSIMNCTLVGGEQFNVNAHLIFIFIPWMVLGGFFMFIPLFIPLHILKKEQTGSLKAKPGCLWLCGVLIVGTLLAALYSLPTKRKIYLNCSEPITNPIETIEAQVKIVYDHRSNGRNYYTDFGFTYEGKDYKLRGDEYVKGAYEGIPVLIKYQKGARGLPILNEIAIPDIGWSVNLLENTSEYVVY